MARKTLLLTACLLFAAPALADPASDGATPSLESLHRMRMQTGRDQAHRDAELRNRTGVRSVAARSGDRPTLSAMRAETLSGMDRITNHFRCLDVDVDVEGGEGSQNNIQLVCGDVNQGSLQSANTKTEGDLNVSQGVAP